MEINELLKEFLELNGDSEEKIKLYFAPGRVNLIGEHTDYNGGYVLPFSLQYGTYLVARKATDPLVKFKSKNFPMLAQVCLQQRVKRIGNSWVNYPLGVIREFDAIKPLSDGLELLYYGDIPNEAGLSSSASIEMVTAYAINDLYNYSLPTLDLIKMSQKAENTFVGMNCGIMDQFAVGMGREDTAVFLNCNTLEYKHIPFNLSGYTIIIANTNKKRTLSGSKYNERRAQCVQAVKDISTNFAIPNLSVLSPEDFELHKSLIHDSVSRKRAQHIVSENQRVLDAIVCLKNGDLKNLGLLMTASHHSLRDLYEVSCNELDVLVEEALHIEGVLGSRMTGAGFGGCTISLVADSSVETFIELLGNRYLARTGLVADFYIGKSGKGAGSIDF
ncbi:MAG: galactokinase [Bacteroidales bacterium]|nr:galactokinase [Bacteroidales bacterium]MCF8403865.1 galactokinase [Bacteroidales bacterium]